MSGTIEGLECAPGLITLRGVRFLLIRPETIVGFQKAVEREAGEASKRYLMAGGVEGGGRSARRLRDGGLKGREVVDAMCRMGTQIGWGRFRIEKFAEGGFEIAIESSPYAEAYGASPKPVCHFLTGVAQGIGEAVYGAASALEIACASAGARECRFEVKKA
jgi:predicted hydrocarbon binding protein